MPIETTTPPTTFDVYAEGHEYLVAIGREMRAGENVLHAHQQISAIGDAEMIALSAARVEKWLAAARVNLSK